MKAKIEQVQKGLTKYIDGEIINHLEGWQKIGTGTAAALLIKNLPQSIEQFKDKIAMFGILDENMNIDIEALHDAAFDYFPDKGEYIDIPMLGRRIKLEKKDLETLYKYIKES